MQVYIQLPGSSSFQEVLNLACSFGFLSLDVGIELSASSSVVDQQHNFIQKLNYSTIQRIHQKSTQATTSSD
jgi:hypothetical protein